jgi:hypothetical protein
MLLALLLGLGGAYNRCSNLNSRDREGERGRTFAFNNFSLEQLSSMSMTCFAKDLKKPVSNTLLTDSIFTKAGVLTSLFANYSTRGLFSYHSLFVYLEYCAVGSSR